MTKWVYLSLALIGVVILATVMSRRTRTQAGTDVASIEREIRQQLPLGSSRTTVVSYLDQRHIHHSYVHEFKDSPEYNRTEMALIRNVSHSGPVRRDVQILFKFDDHSKLTAISVKEIFTGP